MSQTLSATSAFPISSSPLWEKAPTGNFVREELKTRHHLSHSHAGQGKRLPLLLCGRHRRAHLYVPLWCGISVPKEWFDLVPLNEIDTVYICGLEIEETTGEHVVEFLKRTGISTCFLHRPCLNRIRPELLERLYGLHPILHLNETEALTASSTSSTAEAASLAFSKNREFRPHYPLRPRLLFLRIGNAEETIAPVPVVPVDTIGAGDSHIGAVMACLKQGDSLAEAVQKANPRLFPGGGYLRRASSGRSFEKLGLV